VLGPLEVVVDGRSIELPGAKARLLLAALIVRVNEMVSTDRLFEVLWGAQPPESAANTLQTYVAHLPRIPAAVPARPAPGVSGEQAAARGRAAAAERRWQDARVPVGGRPRRRLVRRRPRRARRRALVDRAAARSARRSPTRARCPRRGGQHPPGRDGGTDARDLVRCPAAMSVAGGWFQWARRLLENEPECVEHGFLEWAATMFAIATGRHEDARESA
jgi:hypothetical protein